jgi:hypothetical protein
VVCLHVACARCSTVAAVYGVRDCFYEARTDLLRNRQAVFCFQGTMYLFSHRSEKVEMHNRQGLKPQTLTTEVETSWLARAKASSSVSRKLTPGLSVLRTKVFRTLIACKSCYRRNLRKKFLLSCSFGHAALPPRIPKQFLSLDHI